MIDFLKHRIWCAAFSAVIFITFIGAFVYKTYHRGEAFVYSVDFTGGTQIVLQFSKDVAGSEIVSVLESKGWSGAAVREFSSKEFAVRVKGFEGDAKGLGERIKTALEEAMSETQIDVVKIDSVGSGIGASLRWKSFQAIVVALLLMLIYIWWRFWSFAFAFGNVVSLFHDAIVILLFFLLFDYEISLNVIGAILAVLGYSINDTIVIFSRIRENVKKMRNESIETVVNVSINETLRRTLLTSFATSLTVVALLLFGGESLSMLALTLLIGMVFGTYSSIYIASPVMLMFYKNNRVS